MMTDTNDDNDPNKDPHKDPTKNPNREPDIDFANWQAHLNDLLKKAQFQFGHPGARPGAAASGPEEGEEESEKATEILRRIREFNRKPREVRDYLDRFVIQQAEAKKVLSVAICDHFNHVRRCIEDPALREQSFAKQNIILLGPTGVGKTYLMRCIARLIGVPFVKADATKFSETGYVGHDVEDMVRDLVKLADGNTELAQYGIIYIDEIDKIAGSASAGGTKDVSGRGVQINLLKLMEETEVSLHSQTDLLGQMQAMMDMQRGKSQPRTISTRHILFIVSGAFDNLGEIVRRRIAARPIGFQEGDAPKDVADDDILEYAAAKDFIQYGFEPEFIGRLPIRVPCRALTVDDLEQILIGGEESVLEQYREDFRGYGMEFEITREALRAVAERAEQEQTGARGLMTVLERLFRLFKFELPSTGVTRFEVTTDTMEDPAAALTALLLDEKAGLQTALRADIEAYADRFRATSGLELVFTDEAMESLVGMSLESDKTIRALCEERFKDFEFGLRLVADKRGITTFTITPDVVSDPDRELSKWVMANYPQEDG